MDEVHIEDVWDHLPGCATWRDVARHARSGLNERTLSVRKDIPVGPSDIASYPHTVWYSEIVTFLRQAGLAGDAARGVVAHLMDNELLEMLATVADPREDSIVRFVT